MIKPTIAIIGTGLVGSTIAYSLCLQKLPVTIILVDCNTTLCSGQSNDINDACTLHDSMLLYCGSFTQAAQADIIIIAAGIPQKINQSRMDLLKHNKKVIQKIFFDLGSIQKNAIIIMVTNPVDVLSFYAFRLSELPSNQIIGSGTFLDTQRLHFMLAKILTINPQSIQAHIIGAHNDTQFPAWSAATIEGIPLFSYMKLSCEVQQRISQEVAQKAYKIIQEKGATNYGIAACITNICSMILFDEKKIVPISSYQHEYNVYFSMPAILTRKGIKQILNLPLNLQEKEKLNISISDLKKYTQKLF